ncbi:hypothetical protein IW261DRAFT_1609169 [Armillaria novae-zelandiae]|uniref:Uncharacterized protein n=1 Tax=Armillaria novae-zelandiae TaxID=153914 RepID=A0AA39P4X7_9AGAR|nr:hypothetical protein IW261DRAFT_1609169 [Armillaria novae-zelandiae]
MPGAGQTTEWSVEELIAMQISYITSLAGTLGEEKLHDVIVTARPHSSQFERDTVEISGLRTTHLRPVNDGTALAVNYPTYKAYLAQAGISWLNISNYQTNPEMESAP